MEAHFSRAQINTALITLDDARWQIALLGTHNSVRYKGPHTILLRQYIPSFPVLQYCKQNGVRKKT